MNHPLVSVVILNYNGRKNLGEYLVYHCLSSVLKSDYPDFEVIFVDNGSTDGSVEFVKERIKENPKLKIVRNKENYGFALGNNLGIKHTNGKYVLFLNNDIEVESQWIKKLVKVMEADPTIGMAQSKILSIDKLHIRSAGNLLDPMQFTYLIGYNQEDRGQFSDVCEITFASGAAFIIRRALIDKIGLFDPEYFFYHDDCDLGWRARLAGFKIVMVPSSVVYHIGRGTSTHTFIKNQTYFFLIISRLGLFIKNYEYKNILKYGTIMIVSVLMDILGLLSSGDPSSPFKVLIWIFRNFKHNWQKRQEAQLRIRKVCDDEMLKTFLDSSIFMLRLTRYFSKMLGGELHKHFDRFASDITRNYYLSHIYEMESKSIDTSF